MKKSTIGIIVTVVVLICAIAVLLILNADNARELAERRDEGFFVIRVGEETFNVNITTLENAGIRDFTATRRGGGRPAEELSLRGVPLAVLCQSLGIDISGAESFAAMAADGFSSVVSGGDARDAGNVFIAVSEVEGEGPFMMVVSKDEFSNRWCRQLAELIIR